MRGKSRRERGFVLVVMVFGMMLILSTVGLGVDAGVAYVARIRLQAAVDASALAAARSLNTSLTTSQQVSDAATVGTNFFNGNFPPGMFNTTSSAVAISSAYGTTSSTLNTFYITADGSTMAPTYFMKLFSHDRFKVTARATASRRDINVILVLDRSGSMNTTQAGTSQTACAIMKSSASAFVDLFSNNRDTLGLVAFNIGSSVAFAPSTDFNSGMKAAINALTCGGGTNTSNGLNRAYAQLQALNNPGKLNVIVLFTDGQANALTADFPVKMVSDTRYGIPNGTSNTTVAASPCQDAAGRVFGQAGWNPFKIGDPNAGSTDNTMRGAMAPGGNPDATGWTYGLFSYNDNAESNLIPSSTACAQTTASGLTGLSKSRQDIAYIPATDLYGNATQGYRTNYDFTTGVKTSGQDTFASGHPYAGQIRPDNPRAMYNAGYNAAENQGIAIRNDTTLNPMICTIGLGGNSGLAADSEMLIRMANVPSGLSPAGATITNGIYNSAKPSGNYVYAPSASQLSSAFAQVASFVAELAY
jgi:Flp pilus assembly protein TadG